MHSHRESRRPQYRPQPRSYGVPTTPNGRPLVRPVGRATVSPVTGLPVSALTFADVTSACGDEPGLLCEVVFDRTGSERIAGLTNWLIDRPLRIGLILLAAYILSKIVSASITRFVDGLGSHQGPATDESGDDSLVTRGMDRVRSLGDQQLRTRQRTVTLAAVLKSLARSAIWFFAALMILGEVDINLAPLIAGAGVAGVALGFGAQSLVRDFLAGIFILIEDQYGVGDIVDVGEAIGVIESVTLRTTRLRDAAGVLWIVPNGEIRRVGNTSQLWSKSLLDIEVAYDTDLDFATQTIKSVLDTLWHENLEDATIIEEPQVLGVESFGPDAIVIRAVVKTEPAEQFVVARVIRARLKRAFDEAGIEIPFPQRTIWLRNESTSATGDASEQPGHTPQNEL